MAFKWQLLLLGSLLLCNLSYAFIIHHHSDCFHSDNETHPPRQKYTWMLNCQRNLGKYRNFYANLLQEENQNFAVEIQELYNIVSLALVETDIYKTHRMLYYANWLIDTTKHLDEYLQSKGVDNI